MCNNKTHISIEVPKANLDKILKLFVESFFILRTQSSHFPVFTAPVQGCQPPRPRGLSQLVKSQAPTFQATCVTLLFLETHNTTTE